MPFQYGIILLRGVFMYRKKDRRLQKENVTISLEKLVPENHLLRIIYKAIDFNLIYDER